MYTPEKFRVDEVCELHDFMRAYSFATLITVDDSRPVVSHIPVHLDHAAGQYGKVSGHFARANPHWQHMSESPETMLIFHGPHEYITPAWYETKPLNVPTWNYMAVHAQGMAHIVGEEALINSLMQLVMDNESVRPDPWKLVMTEEMRQKLLPSIVGFEIVLTSIEGKYKISQNRMHADQLQVMQRLDKLQTPSAQSMVSKMKNNLGVK